MAEYLAPGVYIEETSYRAKSIEGVSTTTTGFIGPTRYGPVIEEPDVVTSLGQFERAYGGGEQLRFGGTSTLLATVSHNYMWHAARAFFAEGGRRLYVSRTFRRLPGAAPDPTNGVYTGPDENPARHTDGVRYLDGHGRWESKSLPGFKLTARYPGAAGNLVIQLQLKSGLNVLGAVNDPADASKQMPVLGALTPRDVVWIRGDASLPISPLDGTGDFYVVDHEDSNPERDARKLGFWTFETALDSPINSPLSDSTPLVGLQSPPSVVGDATHGVSVRVVTVSVTVLSPRGDPIGSWANIPLDPRHRTGGASDSFTQLFGPGTTLDNAPFTVTGPAGLNGLDVLAALFGDAVSQIMDTDALAKGVVVERLLEGGSDGDAPSAAEYEGTANDTDGFKTGLMQFEGIDDISIVAGPGSTWNYDNTDRAKEANTIIGHLLGHADRMKYRIAVIDCAESQTISQVRKMRAKLDSKYGAFYYPWVRVLDPITRVEIGLPPSGFVAGIYARNDIERAVYKAPANEVVRSAISFEKLLNKGEQEVLNPEGVNCFRYFPGRGFRLWGARLLSSDPEWKYVNLRRYFAYLEHSIDKGTQWAVFEPNGELLWANVRRTIEDFLLNEWLNGALLGEKPDRAFFVKCDRSTMSQNDLDNGRLVCLIGVAALRPAEFVIFRIGQWTGDRKV